jgi:hypothetical protein
MWPGNVEKLEDTFLWAQWKEEKGGGHAEFVTGRAVSW